MSALELDDRRGVADLHYAPPRSRNQSEETTIRPVLERLSRGERQENSNAASASASMPEDAPMATHHIAHPPKIPFTMAARLALAIGLVAALAIPAVAFLKPRAEQSKPAVPLAAIKKVHTVDMPKKVHTISFQMEKPAAAAPNSTIVEKQPTAPPEQSAAPPTQQQATASDGVAMAPAEPAQRPAQNALALVTPLKAWSMFPDEVASTAWSPPAQPPKGKFADEVAAQHAAGTSSGSHSPVTRHVRHHSRHYVRRHRRHYRHHHRRRHYARRPAAPTLKPAQQSAQPADAQTAAAQPTKPNPIQAAINALLGKQ